MSFQNIWEELRKNGNQVARFPYEKVISFVLRYYPKNKSKNEVKILEVGCGAGNNLWPLALEGFQIYGIDGSETAIKTAKEIFNKFKIDGKFSIQDFTTPFPFDEKFDLVIDRAALTNVEFSDVKKALDNIYEVLNKGGYFFFNPYSTKHYTYKSSTEKKSEKYVLTCKGMLAGVGYVYFYDMEELEKLFDKEKWEIVELKHLLLEDKMKKGEEAIADAEWEVIVRKK